ncbi:MAG: hypothetical protein GC165_06110 [Armatimonadetes bacterium]|nr:hypothetical protein [Armatimonadota bacterium]
MMPGALALIGFLVFNDRLNAAIALGLFAGLCIYLNKQVEAWIKGKPKEPYGPEKLRKTVKVVAWLSVGAAVLIVFACLAVSPFARAFFAYATAMTLAIVLAQSIDLVVRRETA